MNNLVVSVDAEWGYRGNHVGCESAWVPVVFCALVLLAGQEFFFLPGRDDRLLRAFLADHRESRFVSHSATAEMKYLLRLGMPIPERWHDTFVAERWLTNRPRPQPKAGLAAALERRNLAGCVWSDKSEFRDKILRLDYQSNDPEVMGEIIEYCLQDCRGCAELFVDQTRNLEDRAKLERLMSWYPRCLLAVSKMELRGIPVDTATHSRMTRHRSEMREKLAAEINAVAPHIMDPGGLNRDETRAWFIRKGHPLPSQYDRDAGKRKFSISNEALKEIEYLDPFIAKMRQTQKTLVAMRSNKLVMDMETGRHYFDITPFGTVTGRNNPNIWLFGLPKWFRCRLFSARRRHGHYFSYPPNPH